MRINWYFTLLVICLHGCVRLKSNSFFIEGASMQNVELHEQACQAIITNKLPPIEREFVVTGHRISEGEGFIIASRIFNQSRWVDQAEFEKLTIYIPAGLPLDGSNISLRTSGVIAFFSTGSANFPGQTGCFGYASDGLVNVISHLPNQVSVRILAFFQLTSPGGWENDCGKFNYDQSLVLKRKDVKSLTSWEGAPGKHIYDESMMR